MVTNRNDMRSLLEPQYQQMIKDGGFSQVHKNRMMSSVIGGLSSAKGQFDADLGRDVAAQGMQNTGLKARNMLKANRNYSRQIADASTGIDIEGRNEFWRALQGAQGMYEGLHGMSRDYTQAKQQDDANSFWGTFKRGLASGLASGITGGMNGGRQ